MSKNILLFHIVGLGDFVETLGVLKNIREHYKDDKIILVVSDKTFELAKKLNFIDEIYKWPTKKGHGFDILNIKEYIVLLKKLKKHRYDVFINLHEIGSIKGSLMMEFLIKILKPRLTVGRNTNDLGKFFDIKIQDSYIEEKNQYNYYCDVVNALGIKVNYKNIDVIEEYVAKNKIIKYQKEKNQVVFGIGSDRKTRFWCENYFAKIAEYLLSKYENMEILLAGLKQHFNIGENIVRDVSEKYKKRIMNLCGQVSLEEIFFILRNSKVVISTNSAIMHISSNLGVNTIGIIGSGHPFRDKPYSEDKTKIYLLWKSVGCNPCYFYECPLRKNEKMKCMKTITPEDVIEALKRFNI